MDFADDVIDPGLSIFRCRLVAGESGSGVKAWESRSGVEAWELGLRGAGAPGLRGVCGGKVAVDTYSGKGVDDVGNYFSF